MGTRVAASVLVGRQPPGVEVVQDHGGSGDEHRCIQAEPDDQRVNARIVCQAGSDAHDLRLAAVEKETSVHCGFLCVRVAQAIGSEVAAEMSRSAEMKAPANMVAFSRANMLNIGKSPCIDFADPPLGLCLYQCRRRAKSKLSLFFSARTNALRKSAGKWHRYSGIFPTCGARRPAGLSGSGQVSRGSRAVPPTAAGSVEPARAASRNGSTARSARGSAAA
jgi:hypothetical protein